MLTITTDPEESLILVGGDIIDEFAPLDNTDDCLLAFSDGTVIRVAVGGDGSRITAEQTGTATLTIDDTTCTATLDGTVRWMVVGVICTPVR